MESGISSFIQGAQSLDGTAILNLSILGIILIVANALTHYFKERISEKLKTNAHDFLILAKSTEPLKRKADNLISRLCNLLLDWASPKEVADLQRILNDKALLQQRLRSLSTKNLFWVEVLAFRFLEFLWAGQQFRSKTQDLSNNATADELIYFISDKLPLMMRGKLYDPAGYITREDLEDLETFFSGITILSPEGPTVHDMFRVLAADDGDGKRVAFGKLLSFLCFDVAKFSELNGSVNLSKDTIKLCAIAHYTVYLIDVYQNLAHNSKWEEYRVLLVSIVKRVSVINNRKIYLYFKNDVHHSYTLTFPENILKKHLCFRALIHLHLRPFWFPRKWAFYWSLRWRARRFMYRHHKKRVTQSGVRIRADGHQYFIEFSEDVSNSRGQLAAYLTGSGRRMPDHSGVRGH